MLLEERFHSGITTTCNKITIKNRGIINTSNKMTTIKNIYLLGRSCEGKVSKQLMPTRDSCIIVTLSYPTGLIINQRASHQALTLFDEQQKFSSAICSQGNFLC